MNRAAALLALAILADCATGRTESGVRVRKTGAAAGWRPKRVILLYPQVSSGAVTAKGETFGTRPLMGSEMAALIHVSVRAQFGAADAGMPEWKDASEDKAARERAALLSTVISREWRATGRPPARAVAELARATQGDAAFIVWIIRYGPSRARLRVKGVDGEVAEAGRASGPDSAGWLNCGLKVALVRFAGSQVAWEAADLVSREADSNSTQEMIAQECVKRILEVFPFRQGRE